MPAKSGWEIATVHAVQILDSRGGPTLAVTVELSDGTTARAGVPSGASTGSREALELRDRDARRYHGRGVLTAVEHVNDEIGRALRGRRFTEPAEIDRIMIDLDGTDTKARLGANAIVGVSLACHRATALAAGAPLWQTLRIPDAPPRLPVPHFNVVNGGVHAPNSLDFQEFMLAPLGAPNLAEAVRSGAEIYQKLKRLLHDAGHATGLGDEGGFAPDISAPEDVLRLLVSAIEGAGYPTGRPGVAIAMDPAASEFFAAGSYRVGGVEHSTTDLIDRYEQIVRDFPVVSIEDGLAEGDDTGWQQLTERLGETVQLVGDDNFVTNSAIIAEAIEAHIANAALIKVNQIGTVSETLDALALCHRSGYAAMISHRSGETEDSFIADLAVGSGCGQLKSGAPARGERVAKYNRLLEIADHYPDLAYGIT